MRAPSELSWVALLFCCTAVSLTTSVAVALAFQQLQKPQNGEKGGRTDKNVATPPARTQQPAEHDTKTREDATDGATDEAKKANAKSAGPLASVEALLASVEELLAKEGSGAENQPLDEPFPSGSDAHSEADHTSSSHEETLLSAKALLASVEEILAYEHKSKTEESTKTEEKPVDVSPELRVDTYFSPEHIAAFDHSEIFRGCSNVSAVIDAIRPYLDKFFRENVWVGEHAQSKNVTILKASSSRLNGRYAGEPGDSDTEDDEDAESVASLDASISQQWRLPQCIDPAGDTQVVLYPGVDARTFVPEKIINVDADAPNEQRIESRARGGGSYASDLSTNINQKPEKKHIVILPGALILGGVFDVSEGSIFIGKHARVEPNTYIKGPCIIGDHSTVRSGAYLGGDMIVGNHVLLRGELKNALIMDHTEVPHPGYFGDSICGINRRVIGPQDHETGA